MKFNYGYDETDKPIPITSKILHSSDKAFLLSASQMQLLVCVLPFLVGEKIPKDDSNWKFYLLLRQIVDIVVSPIISEDLCYTEMLG